MATPQPPTIATFQEQQQKLLRELSVDNPTFKTKNNFIISLKNHGYFDSPRNRDHSKYTIKESFDKITDCISQRNDDAFMSRIAQNPDFEIVPFIRVLYTNSDVAEPTKFNRDDTDASTNAHHRYSLSVLKDKIVYKLSKYPFWAKPWSSPKKHNDNNADFAMRAITFWSENHVLMHLSSAYLFFQYMHTQRSTDKTFKDSHIRKYFSFEFFEQMLSMYLEVHCPDESSDYGEIYELNSVSYWKYTIFALLNLIDFAPENSNIVTWSKKIMNSIVKHLMILSDPTHGIHCFGVAGRAYDTKQFVKLTGYDLNPFITMLKGCECHLPNDSCSAKHRESYAPTYLTGALATTRYVPPEDYGLWLHKTHEMMTEKVSCSKAELIESYSNRLRKYPLLNDMVITPLKWSAGMLLDPDYFEHSMQYAYNYAVMDHPDLILHKLMWKTIRKEDVSHKNLLGALKSAFELLLDTSIPKGITHVVLKAIVDQLDSKDYDKLKAAGCTGVANMLSQYLKGQSYLGLVMKVYKGNRFVMSSLENFNPGISSFQQFPWMINFDGLPVFSRSGLGGLFTEQLTNFNNPNLLQSEDLLVVTHVSQNEELYLEVNGIDRVKVKLNLFWPFRHFQNRSFTERTLRMNGNFEDLRFLDGNAHFADKEDGFFWRIVSPSTDSNTDGRYLACLSTRKLVKINRSGGTFPFGKESAQRFESTSKEDYYEPDDSLVVDGYYTTDPYVTFVLVVGDHTQYASLQEFVEKRISGITVTEDADGQPSVAFNDTTLTNVLGPKIVCPEPMKSIMNGQFVSALVGVGCELYGIFKDIFA